MFQIPKTVQSADNLMFGLYSMCFYFAEEDAIKATNDVEKAQKLWSNVLEFNVFHLDSNSGKNAAIFRAASIHRSSQNAHAYTLPPFNERMFFCNFNSVNISRHNHNSENY